ncbi:ABC transporter permease [Rhizobium sp. Root73]|uniref:amino acid ABC transporter permease n=1 Tax=unclassified Rhizobium TaxID=2613769 RepID=UPI00072BDF71|nr:MULTISPECIES: amino acid ABC transporter permease [unclassified Rhizobium]KQY15061.1 ABC transporter permease [Rhizobium sp. Root1334]KRC06493.1 ABC transporter permease [Rhizobium sp. Root73]
MDSSLMNAVVDALLSGAVTTIKVTAGALAVALCIGIALSAAAFLTSNFVVHAAVRIYVEALRNVPSLTFLFLLYFGLAALGFRLSSMVAAILGLGLIGGAITIDIFRSGFQAVPSGQAEAAASIGLTPLAAFRLIILPQGLRFALPSLGNYAIALIKDTSLVAAIAAPEIMFNARQLVNETFETAFIYGAAALVYLFLTMSVAQGVSLLERRLEVR